MIKRKEKKRLKKLKRMQKEGEGRERKKSFFCLDFLPFENLIFHCPVFFYSALLLFFLFFLFFIFFFPYHVLPSFGLFVFLLSCFLAFLFTHNICFFPAPTISTQILLLQTPGIRKNGRVRASERTVFLMMHLLFHLQALYFVFP